MPPFGLVAAHFAAALCWLALGSVGLIWAAPDLTAGAVLNPGIVALTHCFTLGWVTTSIFGALYQIFPVALGVSARSVTLGYVTWLVLQAGVIALVVGSWWWTPSLLASGWGFMMLAVGGVSWNLLPQRRRAPRGRLVGWFISAGHAGLGLAMLVSAARIGDLLGWWQVDRLSLLAAHVHLAVGAFATITIMGVSSRLLPMFLMSRDVPEWPLRWGGWLAGAGLWTLAAGKLTALTPLVVGGGAAAFAGVGAYIALVATYFLRRTRGGLDPGTALMAVAVGFLGWAAGLGMVLLADPSVAPRRVAAYGTVAVLGWLSLMVAGAYYRIVPFLTWMDRYSARVGQPGTLRIGEVVVPWLGWSSGLLLSAGVALLAGAVSLGVPTVARVGAAAFAAGVAAVLAQYGRLAFKR